MRYAGYGLLFVLAVAAGVAAGMEGMIERAAERARARLAQAMDADVTVGAMTWTLGGEVTLEQVTLRPRRAPDGEPALVAARRVAAELDLSLWRATAELRSVSLDGVRVHLVRRRDGSDNVSAAWRGLLRLARARRDRPAAPEGEAARGPGAAPALPDVTFRDLQVTLDRPLVTPRALGVPERWVLLDGAGALRPGPPTEPPRVALAATFGGAELGAYRAGLGVEASFALTPLAPIAPSPPQARARPAPAPLRDDGDGRAVRRALRGLFTGLEGGLVALGEGGAELLRHLPPVAFSLRVRPDPPASGADGPALGLTVRRSERALEIDGRLGAHRLHGQLEAPTGVVRWRLALGRGALSAYRHWLPAAVAPELGGELREAALELSWDPADARGTVALQLEVDRLALRHPALASETLTALAVSADARLTLDGRRGVWDIAPARLHVGGVPLSLTASVARYDTAPVVKASLRVPRQPAQQLVDGLPRQLLPRLAGVKLAGEVGFALDASLDTADMDTLAYELRPDAPDLEVLDPGDGVNFDALLGSFLHTTTDAAGRPVEVVVGPEGEHWTAYRDLGDHLVAAVTTAEDFSFFFHRGVAPQAIRESLVTNLARGRIVRGASTITQQLAKNLFLGPERTLSRKLQELFIAWRMELAVGKERILEIYLNVIEWGPGIYGVGQAARRYFDKAPRDLSLAEAVLLASMIPAPRGHGRRLARGEVSAALRRRAAAIGALMRQRGRISPAAYDAARPFVPPHLRSP